MRQKELNSRNKRVNDEHEINVVLSEWGFARDNGDWELLGNCFQHDAEINISWFSGTAIEFIKKSRTMVAELKTGEHGKHQIGRSRIRLNGNRAASECHVELMRRVVGEPFDFDTTSWGRFFDLFEKREDGVWRIFRRTMVYEKDRFDPVNPAHVPDGFFEQMNLSEYPPACKFLCYRLDLKGYKPQGNIIQSGSKDEARLKKELKIWLENALPY